MSQIKRKWIEDGAINNDKIDQNDDYKMASLDASNVTAIDGTFTNLSIGILTQDVTDAGTFVAQKIIASDMSSGYKKSLMITDQMALSELEGGAYFGHVGLTENQWTLNSFGDSSWIARDSARAWTGVAMTSDGKRQTALASQIHVSEDFGQTWSIKDYTNTWWDVAMSADGKFQTVVSGSGVDPDSSVVTSDDYGDTWTQRDSNRQWWAVAMSADGKFQTAVVNAPPDNYIYLSTDFGVTWAPNIGAGTKYWFDVAMSSDGQVQTATVNGGRIYVSKDYGQSFTAKDSVRDWAYVAMSSDGKVQTAGVDGGHIYTSDDYGDTWIQRDDIRDWYGIALSSDGQIQVAGIGAGGGYLFVSTDYGKTWNPKNEYRNWWDVAMSSDGKIMTAVAYGDKIYTSYADSSTVGNVGIVGYVFVTKNVTVQSDLLVIGDAMTQGDLEVSGDATIQGNMMVVGDINIGSFGDTTINGNLEVAENILINGDSTIRGGSDVDGNLMVTGDSSVVGLFRTAADATIGNNMKVLGNLGVLGDATIGDGGNLKVNGDASVAGTIYTSDSSVNNNLFVSKDATVGSGYIQNNFKVSGDSSVVGLFKTSSDSTIGKNLKILGDSSVVGTSYFLDATVFRSLQVTGDGTRGLRLGSGVGGISLDFRYDEFSSDYLLAAGGSHNLSITSNANIILGPGDALGNGYVQNQGHGLITPDATVTNDLSVSGKSSLSDATIKNLVAENVNIISDRTDYKESLISIDQMQLAQLHGGAYFGRNRISENPWDSSKYGSIWNQVTLFVGGGASGAMSADGKIQTIVGAASTKVEILTSDSKGASWDYTTSLSDTATSIVTGLSTFQPASGLAMSADGKFQTCVIAITDGGSDTSCLLLRSEDYGTSWGTVERTTDTTWTGVAMSSDGRLQTAAIYGDYLYRSEDFGINWGSVTGSGSRNWSSIATSSDGKIQIASVSSPGYLYRSLDYGISWTALTSAGSRQWSGVAMSSDGQIQTAVVGIAASVTGYIYCSTDYGYTWTEITATGTRQWTGVAMSSDGKNQSAVSYGCYLWTSVDYGATWIVHNPGPGSSATSIAVSSDGNVQLAVGTIGPIEISHAMSIKHGYIKMLNLPSTDPHDVGVLFIDGTNLCISIG